VIKTLSLYADETERGQRPAAESIAAVRAAGDFDLYRAGPVAIAERLAELGRACPSTAWVVGTCATGKTLMERTFPASVHPEPDALMCGSGMPFGRAERGPDGIRVTGRWPNVSGCEDAEWTVLGVLDDGVFSIALMPVADLTVDRTWHMAGMRGTGSHSLVAEGVPVPAERIAPVQLPGRPGDMLTFGLTVLGPVVGATRGALDVIGAMFASDRKPHMTAYARMAESPGARQWLAEATNRANRAERTMRAVAEAAAGEDLSPADGTRWHMDLADAARDCRAAVDLLLDLHGAGGFAESNPLQRFWRDVAVGSRHPHLNPYLAVENYGVLVSGGQ
jgi:alkylation response protein AidB-like acyl-CoA dehydrogenase